MHSKRVATRHSSTRENPYQVLLIEDDLAHEQLISRSFETHKQYQLTTKHTLNDARHILTHYSPDLIITDFCLPDGNGIDLLEQFLQNKSCPVIVMTSFGDEAIAVKAMKAGASDYIVKSDQTLIELPIVANRVLREWRLILDKKIPIVSKGWVVSLGIGFVRDTPKKYKGELLIDETTTSFVLRPSIAF